MHLSGRDQALRNLIRRLFDLTKPYGGNPGKSPDPDDEALSRQFAEVQSSIVRIVGILEQHKGTLQNHEQRIKKLEQQPKPTPVEKASSKPKPQPVPAPAGGSWKTLESIDLYLEGEETKVTKTDEQWREELAPEQYEVLRKQGTEPPFTGRYVYSKEDGMYRCAACGEPFDYFKCL